MLKLNLLRVHIWRWVEMIVCIVALTAKENFLLQEPWVVTSPRRMQGKVKNIASRWRSEVREQTCAQRLHSPSNYLLTAAWSEVGTRPSVRSWLFWGTRFWCAVQQKLRLLTPRLLKASKCHASGLSLSGVSCATPSALDRFRCAAFSALQLSQAQMSRALLIRNFQ